MGHRHTEKIAFTCDEMGWAGNLMSDILRKKSNEKKSK